MRQGQASAQHLQTHQQILCLAQVYSVQDSPLCLTGTAEVPLGGIYMDKVGNFSSSQYQSHSR